LHRRYPQNLLREVRVPVSRFANTIVTPVHAGRIWWFSVGMGPDGKWRIEFGLSEYSLPVRPKAVVQIEAKRMRPGCATRPQLLVGRELATPPFLPLVPPR
jgi:hypothetical protein